MELGQQENASCQYHLEEGRSVELEAGSILNGDLGAVEGFGM